MSDPRNRVQLIGLLGNDPQLGTTGPGQAVLNLRIATERSWLEGNARRKATDWHTCVVWGKQAEGLSKILRKGMWVVVQGRLQTRTWDDKGQRRYRTEVVVDGDGFILPPKPKTAERGDTNENPSNGGRGAPRDEDSYGDDPQF